MYCGSIGKKVALEKVYFVLLAENNTTSDDNLIIPEITLGAFRFKDSFTFFYQKKLSQAKQFLVGVFVSFGLECFLQLGERQQS